MVNKKYINKVICLIVICSLCTNCMVYASKNLSPLAKQVEKYTSQFDDNEINQLIEDGEYEKAKSYIENTKDGFYERWSLKGLTSNELYIAYQFKEYMTDGFFSQGWWAKITTWASAFFYNDELKDYLTLKSPGKEKYKDMLRLYISQTEEEMVCNEYAQEIMSALNAMDELNTYVDEETFNDLLSASEKGKDEVDTVLFQMLNENPEIMKHEEFINSLAGKLSSALKKAGYTLDIVSSTAELISNIGFINAEFSTYDKYKDFLLNIQTVKNKNGDYVAPEDLRRAAFEISKELQGKYEYALTNFINEIAYSVTDGVVDALGLIESKVFSQITIGIDIATFIGNVSLDMTGLVKGVSYVQGYAYIGEIYSIILNEDKDRFVRQKNEVNAMQFIKDYEILLNIRKAGEEAYLNMSDFPGTWNKDDQKCLQKWTNYEEKKNFCDNNIEMIKSFKFIMPEIIENRTADEQKQKTSITPNEAAAIWEEFLISGEYSSFINDWDKSSLEYTIVDVNSDEIPELFIQASDIGGEFYNTWIFVLENRNIVFSHETYGYGSFRYSPSNNAIIGSPEWKPFGGTGYSPFYSLHGTQLEYLFEIGQDEGKNYYRDSMGTKYISDNERSSYYTDVVNFMWKRIRSLSSPSSSSKTDLSSYMGTDIFDFIKMAVDMYDGECNYSIKGIEYGMSLADATELAYQFSNYIVEDLPYYKLFKLNEETSLSFHANDKKVIDGISLYVE